MGGGFENNKINDSSFIEEIGYNKEYNTLQVKIRRDEKVITYMYSDVPRDKYVDFLAADSKGRYYNDRIKGRYETIER